MNNHLTNDTKNMKTPTENKKDTWQAKKSYFLKTKFKGESKNCQNSNGTYKWQKGLEPFLKERIINHTELCRNWIKT